MPGGRPSKIDQVARTRTVEDRDVDVTVADVIVEQLRAGNYIEAAAAAAGVAKQTVYTWQKNGAAALAKLATGEALTPDEARYATFVEAVDEAQGVAQVTDVTRLAQLATGGLKTTTVTEKVEVDSEGNERVIERTRKTETTLPNAAVLMWRLERRWPELFGRVRHEHSGPDGGPIPTEVRVSNLLDAMRTFVPEGEDGDTALTAGGGHS